MDVCWPVPASSEGTYLVDLCVLTHLCIWIKMGSEPQCDDYLGHRQVLLLAIFPSESWGPLGSRRISSVFHEF